MQTYLFYDTETTGLNKPFDQVLHFAAIRTDLGLKELERYELKIKLNPDVIPSPMAILTHQMGIDDITTGMNECDAIKQIHQWMNTPGTISIGYNTLGFDDEFLRFSFYRNLLLPYTHQYANQCSRMDIYPMAMMYYLFKNAALKWPEIDGKISFKLEALNAANQLVAGRAHHAMVDVEATLELARRFYQEQTMWDYLTGYFDKKTDNERLLPLQQDMALMVDSVFGLQKSYQCPVLYLGMHRHYKNQSLWLRLDSDLLSETSAETISATTWAIHKKPGEPHFVLPFKERFLHYLSADRLELAKRNIQWLEAHPALHKEIAAYHANFTYPVFPETDSSAKLYVNGFWSSDEEKLCQRFHKASPTEKSALLDKMQNPTLRSLALRILGRHYHDAMTPEQADLFADYLQSTRVDHRGQPYLTAQKALQEITELQNNTALTPEKHHLLQTLESYLTKQFSVSLDKSKT